MTQKKTPLQHALSDLDEAKVAVETATSLLEKLLSEIQKTPRAEKTAVSNAIETALKGLTTARVKVLDAEHVLASSFPEDAQ